MYCFNDPVSLSDANGNWAVLIIVAVVNHIINAANENAIEAEIQETYTTQEAEAAIDAIVEANGGDSGTKFEKNGVHITNSVSVNSRYDRRRI